MSNMYMYTGIGAFLYSVYAGLKFYALTGKGLISSDKAKNMIKGGKIELVVDVRTRFEWDRGHYRHAVHIPATALKPSKFTNVTKNTGILVYCNTGQRARKAAETIRSYGFENVYYIEGGYWTLT